MPLSPTRKHGVVCSYRSTLPLALHTKVSREPLAVLSNGFSRSSNRAVHRSALDFSDTISCTFSTPKTWLACAATAVYCRPKASCDTIWLPCSITAGPKQFFLKIGAGLCNTAVHWNQRVDSEHPCLQHGNMVACAVTAVYCTPKCHATPLVVLPNGFSRSSRAGLCTSVHCTPVCSLTPLAALFSTPKAWLASAVTAVYCTKCHATPLVVLPNGLSRWAGLCTAVHCPPMCSLTPLAALFPTPKT